MSSTVKAPILLLQGPPGTGKTSIAQSLAKALGRKFHRISLGGVRDEAEIRGHRRTYVGAMPGLIVQALKKVGCCDPVILLDEIDKMSSNSHHGDPSAAMLEVLDPEQNHSFNDHYMAIPIDLSKVLFIATANSLETIPAPLLDRMETISLPGYTFLEKKSIAERHLIPKQARMNGLTPEQTRIAEDIILKIATEYTREAGVRNLEREIGAICRYKAVEFAESKDDGKSFDPAVTSADVEKILGLQKFDAELAETDVKPGVVTGLAYMGSGNGGLLFLEAIEMPGKSGSLQLTGSLGDVIKESAHIALSYVRANAYKMGLPGATSPDVDIMKDRAIHIHAPAGATPKDGPSAGVAMTLALTSLFLKKPVPPHIAMTGEITLRGNVLPIGGVKEKVLAAHRAGIRTILLPLKNKKDAVADLPENVRQDLRIVFCSHFADVLAEVWQESREALSVVPSLL